MQHLYWIKTRLTRHWFKLNIEMFEQIIAEAVLVTDFT